MSISLSVTNVLKTAKTQVQDDLEQVLATYELPEPLHAAVHHAVMLGGKRVRPALSYAVSTMSEYHRYSAAVRRAAVAVELIHCYSLVHDDLPCMDNDALRRGQPTCHIAFGEDTALLAGDVLQSMAYEVLTSDLFNTLDTVALDASIVLKQVKILAAASSKMVAGQVLDLQAEGQSIDQAQLENIHKNKTGALIQAAVEMSAVTIWPNTDDRLPILRRFSQIIGLAFQVQDDILDVVSETAILGKTAGKDTQVDKSTYPALMGLNAAKLYAQQLHEQALEALEALGDGVEDLYAITQFLLVRQS